MRAALVVAIALLIGAGACGGSQKKSGGGVASGSGAGSGIASDDGGGGGTAAGAGSGVASDAPLTHDDCVALIGHILDIAAAEKTGKGAPEGDEAATARKRLIDEQAEPCMQQTSRATFTCAMAAKRSADLQACPP